MSLTPAQTRELVRLLREFMRLQAEVRTLASILEAAVRINQPPVGWLDLLKEARKSQEYRSISEQYEAEFSRIEQNADETALYELSRTMPSTKILN